MIPSRSCVSCYGAGYVAELEDDTVWKTPCDCTEAPEGVDTSALDIAHELLSSVRLDPTAPDVRATLQRAIDRIEQFLAS